MFLLLAATGVAVTSMLGATMTSSAYVCAHFTNPTVDKAWQTVCYAPCALRKTCG